MPSRLSSFSIVRCSGESSLMGGREVVVDVVPSLTEMGMLPPVDVGWGWGSGVSEMDLLSNNWRMIGWEGLPYAIVRGGGTTFIVFPSDGWRCWKGHLRWWFSTFYEGNGRYRQFQGR